MWELFVEDTPFSVCIPDFSMLVFNFAELPEEKLQANLADNAMLLLLQTLLLRHPVEQIARIFLLLNRELMDTIRLFLNYVQQTHLDITESPIKQSIEEIAMQEGITTPMKSFEEYWFPEFYNKGKEAGKAEGVIEGEARGKAEGLRSAVTSLLLSRFEKIGPSLVIKLNQFSDTSQVFSFVVEVARGETLEDVRRLIERPTPRIQ